MLKIWGLQVIELQSCLLSKFGNDSTPGELELWPNALAHSLAGMAEVADFVSRTLNLTASNFAAL